jgi:NAD(P)-dependent dehydrogenase (short-subunit alcohol dehydrogenase family)
MPGDQKVVVITGAGQGIGREMAIQFAGAGMHVIVVDIVAESAAATTERIDAQWPGNATSAAVDVTDDARVDELFDRVARTHGRIDVLVNNAVTETYEPFLEISQESWRRHIDVDLTSYFTCGQAAARRMVTGNRGGRIINLASINSFAVEPGLAHYAAAKGGVAQLTRAMALELAEHRILVNAIAPGPIATEKNVELYERPEFASSLSRVPLGRPGTPAEIASVALFLASDGASFMTGSIVLVDGGYLSGLA